MSETDKRVKPIDLNDLDLEDENLVFNPDAGAASASGPLCDEAAKSQAAKAAELLTD